MRFELLRVKAVFCAISPKFFQKMPNAPVVGTPENGERSDLRLIVLFSPCKRLDCVGVVLDV